MGQVLIVAVFGCFQAIVEVGVGGIAGRKLTLSRLAFLGSAFKITSSM